MGEGDDTSPRLRPDVLGPFSVAVQSVSFVGPAFSGLLLFQVIAGFAGISVAFAFLIAGAIILMLAASLASLAAHLPSAGGYFTYVTRAVGARAGALLSWLFLVYAPIAPGFIVAYTAYICEQALRAEYGVLIPWWAVVIVVLGLVTFVVLRGIRLSTRTLTALGMVEVGIVVALAVWGLAAPGPGGFTFAPLSPSAAGFHGIYLGVIFSLFAFAGWEGAVPLAEESRQPRRSVPTGLIVAVLFIVALFVLASWGLMVGWGTRSLPQLLSATQAPPLALAHRFWGPAWVIVLLALLNSFICASIASFNTVTRMWYAMARSSLIPSRLAALHPRYRTPFYLIGAQSLLALAVGLGFGFWLGPVQSFLTLSLLTTLALIAIYLAGNLGVVLFHLRLGRASLRPVLHLVFPLLTSVAVVWVGYKSLDPLPPSPVRWAALVGAGWLLLGLAIVLRPHGDGRSWAADAGLALHERRPLEAAEPGAAN